jgi:type IV fimbrial biogenesis protein FimT
MLILRKQRGLTLIELMVGIAIIAIISILAIPSYSDWIGNSRLRNGAESVVNGLQLARAEAVRRNTAVQFQLTAGNTSAWQVGCVTVTATCPANIQSHTVGDGSSANVLFTMVAGANPVVFTNLGRISTAATTWNVDNLTDLTAANSRDLRIVVSAGGTVRMCDPSVVAPDSRAC